MNTYLDEPENWERNEDGQAVTVNTKKLQKGDSSSTAGCSTFCGCLGSEPPHGEEEEGRSEPGIAEDRGTNNAHLVEVVMPFEDRVRL